MKIETAADLETAQNMYFAPDQVEELEIGCEIWEVRGKNEFGQSWWGSMCRWSNGRGAFSANGGQSDWGNWGSPPACCDIDEDYYLLLDVEQQGWMAKWIDKHGVEWVEVRVDEDFDNEEGEKDYWWNLKEAYPAIHDKLASCGRAMVTVEQWEAMQDVDGWCDGPDYAPYPVRLV